MGATLSSDRVVTPPTVPLNQPASCAMLRLSRECGDIEYTVAICNLTSPVTSATISSGAVGVDGTVLKTLDVSCGNNSRNGEAEFCGFWRCDDTTEPLTGPIVDTILTGGAYIRVNTNNNPAGEIRGQIFITNDF